MSETQIGKYTVLGELGKGSMGVVYKAEDPEIGRVVAIKTLRSVYLAEDKAGQEALQRFRQESRSAGKLKHPNIVTIFEAGRSDSGSPYIVMEYIEGDSLENKLRDGQSIEPLEALHILAQVGSAIDYAHTHSIVHRDIKPSNVIIDGTLKPHLLDFGVAKISDTSLTPAGTVVGTPSYMAPEQIRGETLDGGTDRFAFAVLAYEMLTGARPFPGSDFMTVVSNIIHSEPVAFSALSFAPDARFESVLIKGMSKDRAARFATCLEFVQELGRQFDLVADANGILGFRKGDRLAGATSRTAPTSTTDPASVKTPVVDEQLNATVMEKLPMDLSSFKTDETPAHLSEESPAVQASEIKQSELKPPVSSSVDSEETRTPPSDDNRKGVFIGLVALVLCLLGVGSYLFATSQQPDRDNETVESTDETQSEVSTIETKCEIGKSCDSDNQSISTTPLALTQDNEMSQAHSDIVATLSNNQSRITDIMAAVSASGELDYDVSSPLLLNQLRHPDYKVRIAVLKAFTSSDKFRTKEVFRGIINTLEDPEFLVRGFTVKFLASMKSEAAKKLLETRLNREKNETVKKLIEEAIR